MAAPIPCRARYPYRRDGRDGVEEIPAGEPVLVTPAELAQDRARRYPHLLTLEEEQRLKEEADRRRQAEMEQGDPTWRYTDKTARALLDQLEMQDIQALSYEETWQKLTGYKLTPEY